MKMATEQHRYLANLVTDILEQQNYAKLDVEFPEYDTTGGYAAEMIFAKVIGEKDGREEGLNLIIKKSKDTAIIKETFNLRQAYICEVNMYSKFVPYLQKFARERNAEIFENIPHCYGTIARENQYIVFLENLKLSGFGVHDQRIPMNLNHAKLVLQAYAKFHALCFALKDQEPEIYEEFKQYSKPFFGVDTKLFECLVATIHKGLEDIIQVYQEKNRPRMVEKLKLIYEKYENTIRDCLMGKDEDYIVIRHGDCWNNNYLFHYNEDETNPDNVMIIDWQFGIFGSPVADICSFLFFCCSRAELDHIDLLLNLYYDNLSNKLEELGSEPAKCFPKEVLQKSFKRYALIGIAGHPLTVKFCCQVNPEKTYDLAKAEVEGNFNNMCSGIFNEEEYFNRVDATFEFCIERGFL